VTVELAFSEIGDGPPLVILHGLFGSKRNWSSIAKQLADSRRVITVDLRNHGASPWSPVHDYPALASDVTRLVETRLGGRAAVLGHSMGGKAAMMLALERPELVERLVVVDIAPAPSPGSSREFLRAMMAVPLAECSRRGDVEAALAADVPDAAVRSFLVANIVARPDGLAWGVNLEAIADHIDAIMDFPDVPDGRAFTGPVLVLAGGRSPYVQPHHATMINRLFPAARVETIPEAGHWLHADAPAAFLEAVRVFLQA
jgi:pimeloyl-ACP methyl ester carboxylesterase